MITKLKEKVLAGGDITRDEALALATTTDKEALYEAAEEITRTKCGDKFDFCSIINARSGKCPENCKWCAQSAHWNTHIDTYDIVDEAECLHVATYNDAKQVHRLSLVTSGKAMRGAALDKVCDYYRKISESTNLYLCASMGLLNKEELAKLREAGVRRYHCNLESAPSHFTKLCTTHTIDDKIRTINWARELGMEICSGGIIGMGETMEQRVEFAFKLKEIAPDSIPLNLLQPIPGTPLEHATPLTDEEILTTIAVFRFVHPSVPLRFAGGRKQMSKEVMRRAISIGINSAIVGDLLTTLGSSIDDDKQMIAEQGYTLLTE